MMIIQMPCSRAIDAGTSTRPPLPPPRRRPQQSLASSSPGTCCRIDDEKRTAGHGAAGMCPGGFGRSARSAQRQEPNCCRRVGPEQVHESANFLDAPSVAHDNPALATWISNGNTLAGLRWCAATNGGDDVDPGG